MISPFIMYCKATLPTAFGDELSYYETLTALTNFLNKQVIPVVNKNDAKVAELTTLANNLQNYIENYFNNLDVQEEINTKLDEMVTSGQLEDLLFNFFKINVVFNTVAEMKKDSNLQVGQKISTLGYYAVNDGGGAQYIIKNTLDNTKWNEHLNNDLYAELIVGDIYYPKMCGYSVNNSTTTNNSILQFIVNNAVNVNLPDDHIYDIGTITISKSIKIKNGKVNGGFILNPNKSVKNVEFDNIYFKSTINNNNAAISMAGITKQHQYIVVNNCYINGYTYGIYFTDGTIHQGIFRSKFTNCTIQECNYCFYNYSNNAGYRIGDILISGNTLHAYISNIHLYKTDGLIFSNNTCFMNSYAEKSMIKKHNMFLWNINFGEIIGNNFFESGLEAIYIDKCKACNIVGNTVAWSGQRKQNTGNHIKVYVTSDTNECALQISSNNLKWSTGGSIAIYNYPFPFIHDNYINGVGVLGMSSFYYGEETFVPNNYYTFDVSTCNTPRITGNFVTAHEGSKYSNLPLSGLATSTTTLQIKPYSFTLPANQGYFNISIPGFNVIDFYQNSSEITSNPLNIQRKLMQVGAGAQLLTLVIPGEPQDRTFTGYILVNNNNTSHTN